MIHLNCKECPYIDENDKNIRPIVEGWCDKVGGKIWHYGQCSDVHFDDYSSTVSNKINKNNINFIKTNKTYVRNQKYKNRIKYNCKNYGRFYDAFYPCDKDGWYVPIKHEKWISPESYERYSEREFAYFKRCYRKSNRAKWAKHFCNKKVRRYKGKISNGGSYKRIAEFWWQVY